MTEHPDVSMFEGFVAGGLGQADEEALAAHVRTCDACAGKLAREARLEHAIFEVFALRRKETSLSRSSRKVLRFGVPLVTLAAAAALLFFLRRSERAIGEDPSATRAAASLSSIAAGDTPVAGADEVIKALRPQFRKCYQDALAKDPKMSGKAVIVAQVGADGVVLSATLGSNEGLSAAAAECLVGVVRGARFPANGTGSSLHIPVTFHRDDSGKAR
jgi:hypothetical protein